MIDFHTHILPNVDDGSKSMDETIALLSEARKAGFEAIVSTSHYIEDYYTVNKTDRELLIETILENLQKQNIEMNLFLGNEVYISDNIINLLENNSICTINNSKYLLFELPFNIKPINLYDVVYDMLRYKLVPILAHPERYSFIQQNPEMICELIEKGVLMQSNYGSFIGQYGKKAQVLAQNMLKNDMIHFLGTDVHRKNTLYPEIPKIFAALEKLIDKDKLYTITTINPKLALDNKEIEIQEPQILKFSFKDKMILKRK